LIQDTKARLRPSWYLLGPAFVAAIAYVDPGNVAANVSAGAQYGFLLVWVIIVANAMAGLVQYLSAKLGLVTGRSLPEAVADHTRTRTRIAYWLQAELVAMATDLAEVVGGAIALHLLFDLPLLVGGVITGAVSLLLLAIQNRAIGSPVKSAHAPIRTTAAAVITDRPAWARNVTFPIPTTHATTNRAIASRRMRGIRGRNASRNRSTK